MFGIGTWELLVIFVLALLILGPDKLPSFARTVGRTINKLRQTADEVKREIDIDGLGEEIKSEIMDESTMAEIKESLDVRPDLRRAMNEIENMTDLPDPYTQTTETTETSHADQNPSSEEKARLMGPGVALDPAEVEQVSTSKEKGHLPIEASAWSGPRQPPMPTQEADNLNRAEKNNPTAEASRSAMPDRSSSDASSDEKES